MLITRKEAAQKLGVSLPTLDRLIARSDFPVIRVGRSVKIPLGALEDWIAAHVGQEV